MSSPTAALTTPVHSTARTRIKICGLTREQDVDAAVASGADAVGFVLYPASPRAVTPERAAQLARRLPPFVTPVLLFVNARATDVIAACDAVPGATAQFHGDETPEDCLRSSDGGRIPFLRAARIPLGEGAARFDLVNTPTITLTPAPSCSTPMSRAMAAVARHSIGHSFQQTSTVISFCLVDSRLQT